VIQVISGVGSSSNSNQDSSLSQTALAKAGFSQQTFLQLLVTQLKNQDPLNPQDSHEFVAELAQFSSLEQMANMNKSITTVLELSVTNVIGRTVTVLDPQGNTVTGIVDGIVYYADGPAVSVNGQDYAFSTVQNIT
jgi:flagellar basal-body rod modification protein FlgD